MLDTSDPVREYARLLLKQHELDPRGDVDSPELGAICEAMDVPWTRMDGRQRGRMRGLSEDLYALADGRRGIPMSTEDRAEWAARGMAALKTGDLDVYLDHLRRPFPEDFPSGVIPALQAQSWDRLGLPEVALLFYQEAAKVLPMAKTMTMDCLRRLGRIKEAMELAQRLLSDPRSRRWDIYLAASALFQQAFERPSAERAQILEMILKPLRDAIEAERNTPLSFRRDRGLEGAAARALALTLVALRRFVEARQVCDDSLKSYPNDPALLLIRGVANLPDNPAVAETDFERAVAAQAQESLPYAALALFRAEQGKYADTFEFASQALRFPGLPEELQGLLFELRGIALAELKQPHDRVEEEFARARTLNPASTSRIEYNREVALKSLESASPSSRLEWNLPPLEPMLRQLQARLLRTVAESPIQGESYSELLVASKS
jgi:tetratricopeptide (TPR) repeat protein